MRTALKKGRRGLTAIAAIALGLLAAACVQVQWNLPASQISHGDLIRLDDDDPDVAHHNGRAYVVFSGWDGSDYELYLQDFNIGGGAVNGRRTLTSNTITDTQPRIASGDNGYLYVAWSRLDGGGDYNVYWAGIRASDLTVVTGPLKLSTLAAQNGASRDDDKPQIVHVPWAGGYTAVTWEGEPTAQLTNTIFYNRVSDAGVVETPIYVSQGAGCAPASDHQLAPRIARSYANGTYSFVAWYGNYGSGDSVFWRRVDNGNGTMLDCRNLSDLTIAGTDYEVEIDTNNPASRSFIAWSKMKDSDSTVEVFLRSVDINGTLCSVSQVTNDSFNDFSPDIAAGHTISDWAHLVWETGTPSDIHYQLYDASACGSAPVAVTSVYTISPSDGPDYDLPVIDVASNSVIGSASAASLDSIDAAQIQAWVTSGRISQEQADRVLADGRVERAEVGMLLSTSGPGIAVPSAPNVASAEPIENYSNSVPAPAVLDCVADPEDDACLAWARTSGLELQPASAAKATADGACGTGAADAVAVVFYDDSTNDVYATTFQAGEVDAGFGCTADAYYSYGKTTRLEREDVAANDLANYQVLVDGGLAHVTWSGFVTYTFPILIADNYDVFYSFTRWVNQLPAVQKNYP